MTEDVAHMAGLSPGAQEDETFRQMVVHFPEGVIVHRNGRVLFANEKAVTLLGGGDAVRLHGHPVDRLFDPAPRKGSLPHLEEARVNRLDGEQLLVEAHTSPVTFGGKKASLTLFRDTSHRRAQELAVQRQAHFDQLTNLPNRSLFLDRLEHELAYAERKKSRVALMFIDLDHFKRVNDTLGHAAGDQLLNETAIRLTENTRRSDTVARLGGDEFTVILPDMDRGPNAKRVATKILDSLAKPFILERQEAFISGSIGITIYPDDGDNVQDLLKNADTAMYWAKGKGRNAYCFFTPDMQAEAMRRMSIEKDLRKAIKERQFSLHYQPILNLENGRLVGAEAFLRWTHPQQGLIPPDSFVHIAEEMGIIGDLDRWTLETACRQARDWCERRAGDFFITVNLACQRCRDLSMDGKIENILRTSGLPPDALILEITENILMEDEDKAMAMLDSIKRMGVGLWLDDFGTGYSSLSFLKRLPVDGIKIDRIFVQDAPNNPDSGVLVNAMLNVAHNLALKVVGEGVETIEQQQYLLSRGCNMAQGYFFGKPSPAEQFEKWLG